MTSHLLIRPAVPGDAEALRRLAQLDSARRLRGEVLVGEIDGVVRAAWSIASAVRSPTRSR